MITAARNYLVFLRRCSRIAFVGDWRYYAWMGLTGGVAPLLAGGILSLTSGMQLHIAGLAVDGQAALDDRIN